MKLEEQAEKLADKQYSIGIMLDETVDGKRVYLVSHPQLPGCMAEGDTISEAMDNLKDARIEYILSLLEDELPVPSPLSGTAETASTPGVVSYSDEFDSQQPSDLFNDLLKDNQHARRRQYLGTISPVEV